MATSPRAQSGDFFTADEWADLSRAHALLQVRGTVQRMETQTGEVAVLRLAISA
jgi:hypothetical protein